MSLIGECLDAVSVVELVYVAGSARRQAEELDREGSYWSHVWRGLGLECEEALIRRAGGPSHD